MLKSLIHLIQYFVNLKNIYFLKYLFEFIRSLYQFKKLGGCVHGLSPMLANFSGDAGDASGHYFHQDLYVANLVYRNAPKTHYDIGSRIDGFVAHVAAFRVIHVIDVRPLNLSVHPNIKFEKIDLTTTISQACIADSISCLHVIEHFGLGRYRDKIDPNGYLSGIKNIISLLKKGGKLYISFPIGKNNATIFNAHRIFHPLDIFGWPGVSNVLSLVSFSFVDDRGDLTINHDLKISVPHVNYGCGIYEFIKSN